MNILLRNCRNITAFLILFALCWMFPYTGDDWAWDSSIGWTRLESGFKGYNGRDFGNLVVIALTRYNFLKAAAMASCLTGIIWCILYMTQKSWSFYCDSYWPPQLLPQLCLLPSLIR